MILKVKYFWGLLSIVFALGCSKNNGSNADKFVFKYNEHANISSLDPAFAKNQANIWAVNLLFSGLVQFNDSLNIKPDIAKKWSITNGGKKYSFTLRNDVFFHKHHAFGKDSTRQVVAKDFEYSFNRLLSEDLAAPGSWVFKQVSSFKAINDSIFEINLSAPFAPFLGLLGMKYCSVVPQEIVELYGSQFRSNPIGTGPFKFKLWVENTKLVFRKNELYYEKEDNVQLPYLDAVSITFLPDKQSEFLQFVQGNLDFLNSIDPSYKDDILTLEGNLQTKYQSKIEMLSAPYLNTEYLGILMDSNQPEIASEKIRKAINYGFDREKMIRFLRNGIGTPALGGFIPKGLPGYNNNNGYTYNPLKSKQLIDEFKVETGIQNPKIVITTNSQYVDLCEYIQRELQNVGLSITVDVVPPSTLRQSKASGKLPVFRASWIADYPDAENYLSVFYSKNFAPNGPNYMHYNNEEFDKLYETSISETDLNNRLYLYKKMDSLIIADAPIVPLYYDEVVLFHQKNIKNLSRNPINLLNLKRVKKE